MPAILPTKLQQPTEAMLAPQEGAASIGVDRENNRINGLVVALEGPFKTPGRGEFDLKALKMIVKLLKAAPDGVRSRFTHPMFMDGLGTFLGRLHKPRLAEAERRLPDGTTATVKAVRADLHFDETAFDTPGGDLAGYVLDLTESDPAALSSSLVVWPEREYRINKDGTFKRDENGDPLPPLWRPVQIDALDIVDTGDAVDALLSAERPEIPVDKSNIDDAVDKIDPNAGESDDVAALHTSAAAAIARRKRAIELVRCEEFFGRP